jgi:hypothetical protein
MSKICEQSLEEYIVDWYYDEPSKKAAKRLGRFVFKFLIQLEDDGVSERTVRAHNSNCWLICKFLLDYEDPEQLSPEVFEGGAPHLYEFKRKVSESESARKSYIRTWKKLCKFSASQKA